MTLLNATISTFKDITSLLFLRPPSCVRASMAESGEVITGVQKPEFSPLASSYNDKIQPILDAVDQLRRLNVTQEGIPLPSIVVVGDQSSGKSSVLESLAGISLPRGQSVCTRVPLIMRLQPHTCPVPEFFLEFQISECVPDFFLESPILGKTDFLESPISGKTVKIENESQISEAIDKATSEIAGNNKGISDVPLTLVVKKQGAPNLTMIDLPGITRVPVGDQPKDIYEKISGIIMECIKPEECIILNVLPAAVDFTTCESICMSRSVDSTGQRTMAVVTKCDLSPDNLLEKVTSNEVNIGLGYVCVRNRINDETYDEARTQEAILFDTHPSLSMIDKSMVGISVLADRLVHIQSVIISKCLPGIVKKISERLNASHHELNKLPQNLTSVFDAMVAFMQIVGSLKGTLQKILISVEVDELENDKQMHCNARLIEMLDEFSKELQSSSVKFSENFLMEEIQVLEEANGIRLPHFLPHSVFLCLLQRKVNTISAMPVSFVNKVWSYLQMVCVRVLMDCCESYPQLLPSMRKAAHSVTVKMENKFLKKVNEMIEMEKITDYTCDPDFIAYYNKLMSYRHQFLSAMNGPNYTITIEGYGTINIRHLTSVPSNIREQAFDLKMRMTAYWKIVLKRLVDWVALELRFLMQIMVKKEMEKEIVKETMENGGGVEKMLHEPPSVVKKRERLQKSVGLLQQSKAIIEKVMDGIAVTVD